MRSRNRVFSLFFSQNTSQILRESELDLQSQDSWLGYHPWNTRHCALRYDCFQIKESSSDSDANAGVWFMQNNASLHKFSR